MAQTILKIRNVMVNDLDQLKYDHRIIGGIVTPKSKVMDLGCGKGELLEYLVKRKDVQGYGIEINEQDIYSCVEKGLSVSQSDIDSGLADYPAEFFDFVIINQTMQQLHHPKNAIKEALRVGKNAIIGFPNFCVLPARIQLFFYGKVPVMPSLPYEWYNTPNLHFLSIKDFEKFCQDEGFVIEEKFFITGSKKIGMFPNLFAENAIFHIKSK
ncbi:MAG: methionine biosynthesis protein MetW [Candidatus Omnitrophica bacterium]|nr:methionine biosynthesis protein MetW [Candidatus Omnitrophota bacterium]